MLISIVIPVFNEEEVLFAFHQQLGSLLKSLSHDYEVWHVAGGSTDRTSAMIRQFHKDDNKIKLLELSRNYGHQAALTAGLDFATGDVVITMDGDGQHPPRIIPQLIDAFEQGNDVMLTQRRSTGEISYVAKLFSKTFYRLINRLSESEIVPDSADFRLLSREVVQDIRSLHEQHRFLRGMISWMGFQQTIVPFDAPPRMAGRSKFSHRRRLQCGKLYRKANLRLSRKYGNLCFRAACPGIYSAQQTVRYSRPYQSADCRWQGGESISIYRWLLVGYWTSR